VLEEKSVQMTAVNFIEFLLGCDEFGFEELKAKLSEFRHSIIPKEAANVKARSKIRTFEKLAQ
jgi:hypothetical protein